MKKIIMLAMVICTLVSCSSGTSENPHISEPVEEIPAEPVFMEYEAGDFTEIDVKINKQSGEAPVKVSNYDLTGIEWESRNPPCIKNMTLEDYRNEIYPFYDDEEFEAVRENIEKEYEAYLNSEFGGIYTNGCLYEEKFYYIIDYDRFCLSDHAFDIYEYDMKSGENKKLFEYSSADDGLAAGDITCIGGEIYVISIDYDGRRASGAELLRLDTEKGELEKISDMPEETDYARFSECGINGRVTVEYSVYTDGIESFGMEYDEDSGEWNRIFRTDNYSCMVTENDVTYTEKDSERKTNVISDNYTLSTGIRGAEIAAVRENGVTLIVEDSVNSVLYDYDFEKMERYKLDLSAIGSDFDVYSAGEHLILSFGYGRAYMCLIPEIGAAFNIELKDLTADSTNGLGLNIDSDNERMYIVKSGDNLSAYPNDEGVLEYDLPMDTLYVIE